MEKSIDELVDVFKEKIENNRFLKIIEGDRKFMINLAEKISEKRPAVIIIFANEKGDIIAKSGKADAKTEFDKIIEKCQGKGGGRHDFSQGKIRDIEKFKELLN